MVYLSSQIFSFSFVILMICLNHVHLIEPDKLISTHVYKIFLYNKLSILIGSPATLFEVGFDINGDTNWIFEKSNYNPSSTMKILKEKIEVTLDNTTYIAQEIEDTMFLEQNPDKSINFVFNLLLRGEQKVFEPIKGIISFPFKFSNENSSIIHQFKNKGYIDHLSFSFIKSEFKAVLFIGGIKDVYTRNRFHSYCDIIETSSKWSCVISGMIASNKTKVVEYRSNIVTSVAYFDTISQIVSVPKEVFDLLVEKYFTDSIQSQVCNIRHSVDGRYLSCFDEYLFKMGNITFIVGDYEFVLELEPFFICAEEYCHFMIHDNPSSNDWIFGSAFFDMYNILFDYEEKKIHFYSVKELKKSPNVINIKHNGKILYKTSVLLICFVNSIGIIITLFIRIKY